MSVIPAADVGSPSSSEGARARLGVVIPNWNGADVLDECLSSLRTQRYRDFEVLVVDNGSRDGSVELIERDYPEVLVHRCETNTGFTGACNLGAGLLFDRGADFVLLLNNDTVAAPSLLGSLVSAVESDPGIGAVSPYIVFQDSPDQLWYGGGGVDLRTGVTRHVGYRQRPDNGAPATFETAWANGCALLITASAYRAVGLLDPRFFASYEDVDLSLRLSNAGYSVLVATGSVLNHKVSAAMGNKGQYYYYMARNRLIFLREHGARAAWPFWSARMLFGSAAYAFVRLLRRDVPGFQRRAFEFFGVAAFLVGQRGKAPGWVYRYGSSKIRA